MTKTGNFDRKKGTFQNRKRDILNKNKKKRGSEGAISCGTKQSKAERVKPRAVEHQREKGEGKNKKEKGKKIKTFRFETIRLILNRNCRNCYH